MKQSNNIHYIKTQVLQKINILKDVLNKHKIPFIAAGFLLFTIWTLLSYKQRAKKEPYVTPPISQFNNQSIAGIGIVEPYGRLYALSVNNAGIVYAVKAQINDTVKIGDELLTLDNRDLDAQIKSLEANLETAKILSEAAKQQYKIIQKITDNRAISKDEYLNRKFNYDSAASRVEEINMQINTLKAQKAMRIITAPIDGQILAVNVRPGEFLSGMQQDAAILMGNISKLQIRVEIDEEWLSRLRKITTANGRLRGENENYFDLKFLYTEPYILPKTALNVVNKRVDTRVMQVVFEIIPKPEYKIFVGQQMDVYINNYV